MSHNLGSINNIKAPLNRKNLLGWFKNEISDIEPHLQEITLKIFQDLNYLCNFPDKALLLWASCDRKPSSKGKQRYHLYPDIIKEQAKRKNIKLDGRGNGPAIAAFEFAGGQRPERYGSNNKRTVHHLYSGKFPYMSKNITLHATKNNLHFTQAAGLVALHPITDALADESPAFTWFLRYKAYKKFGYDPDRVFSEKIDKWGFDISRKTKLEVVAKT